MRQILAIKLIALTLAATAAVGDTPVFDDWHVGFEVHDGRLVTGWFTGRDDTGLIDFTPSVVFHQQFGHLGEPGVVDWGTNSGGSAFNTPSQVGVSLRGPLHKWNGTTFVPLGTTADEALRLSVGPFFVTSGAGFVAGLATNVRDETTHPTNPGQWGRHHSHFFFTLVDGNLDGSGVYYIQTEWFNSSSTTSVELASTSEPVYLVFGLNVTDEVLLAGANYVQTHVVPEPATLTLFALGTALATMRRRPR